MESKIAGLLGAVAALGTITGAQASSAPTPNPSDTLRASSYADLLEPIPNAAKILQVMDEQAPATSAEGNVKLAQYYYHHHHHHHGYWRRPPVVVVVPPRRYRYYHHHHHHHHGYWYR